jgi:type IV pilus assembly protein PilA
MYANGKGRLKTALYSERDEGFTLIELLVVIIIIGILAAIAIPIFLSQRKQAVDAAMKSDLHTISIEENTYFVDYVTFQPVASSTGTATVGADVVNLYTASTMQVVTNLNGTAFCASVSNPRGSKTGSSGNGNYWVYVSDSGGLQTAGAYANSCPASGGNW